MNKYKNIAIALILIILFFPNFNFAQPYYFERGNITESAPSYDLYEIDRINLSNGIINIFLYKGFEELAFDQIQTWVATGWNNFNYIYNYLDTTNYFSIDPFDNDVLFSQSKNMLYIFCWAANGSDKQLAVYDVNKRQKEAFLNLPINSDLQNEAFFSTDENTIYFSKKDSDYSDQKIDNTMVESYSTTNNQITNELKLSSIGYQNADGYYLHKGRQGKGIIESFINNQSYDSYYNIYDFDIKIGSNFILHSGNAKPFVSQDSKFLLLAEQGLDTLFANTAQFYNTGVLKIYDVGSMSLIKTLNFPARGTFFMSDSYPANIYFIGPINNRIISSINIDSLVQQTFLPVKLVDSRGMNLTTGSLQYYDGTWRDALNNNDGTFLVHTTLNKVNLKMTYEYGTQTLSNVTMRSDTVVFRTVNTQVKLQNSYRAPIDTGTVQYYAGAWRNFGTTIYGVAFKELLPNNYSFRMTYSFASNDKQQDISANPVVIFQTVNTTVQLQNSLGALIDTGTVQYYAGAWRTFGTTSNGIASMELLPNTYSFRMTYAFASNDKQQNTSTNPIVVFQTVNTTVQLKNSIGNLIDQGVVQYYSGAWKSFGATVNGIAGMELLPNTYSFRMTYAFASNDKQQNTSTNPVVVFQTLNTIVQLKNSLGNMIDPGTVQYYSGAWRNFETTSNGIASMELLPNTYSFRMTYAYVSKDLAQNTGTSSIVTFSTVLCTINVNNAQGQPVNNADAKYYSGAWREIGLTTNGIITKELLPANLSFRINYGTTQQDKTQDLSVNNLIQFNLP